MTNGSTEGKSPPKILIFHKYWKCFLTLCKRNLALLHLLFQNYTHRIRCDNLRRSRTIIYTISDNNLDKKKEIRI